MQLAKYRAALPQTGDRLFMTDGGLETTLIFHARVVLREGEPLGDAIDRTDRESDRHASSARLRNLRCARRRLARPLTLIHGRRAFVPYTRGS